MTTNPFATALAEAARAGYLPSHDHRAAAPRAACPTERPLTDRRIAFIGALFAERDLTAEARPRYRARMEQLATDPAALSTLTNAQATQLIDALKALPFLRGSQDNAVPAGRYAVEYQGDLIFVQVDRPETGRWAGHTFVTRQLGPNFVRISRAMSTAILDRIARDGADVACRRYGVELGICGQCYTPLTNADSRAKGIGPVCEKKL